MMHDPKERRNISRILRVYFTGVLVALLLFMLPSCNHGSRYEYQQIKRNYDKPKKPPALLSTPVGTHPPESPEKVMKAAGTLTLEKVIRIALQNNPDLDMAVARIQQSEAMLDEAVSVFWPVIGVYGEYLQGNAPSAYLFKTIDQRKLPQGTDFNNPGWFENYEVGIRGRLNLFNGGRDYLRKRMAETGLAMSRLDRETVQNGLVASVIHAYYSVLTAEEYVNISRDSVNTVKNELGMVSVRYEAGGALKSDVLSLKVALAQSREGLIRSRNNHSLSVSSLANLLGLDPDTPITLARDQQVPIRVPDLYEKALVMAMANRPELQKSRLQVVRSRMDLDVARSEYLPRLDAQMRTYFDDPGFDFEWDRKNWTAGVILNWDVFTGFGRQSHVDRARSVLKEMLAGDRKATLAIQLQLKGAYLKYAEAKARWDVSQASVAHSEESLRLVRKQYEGGSVTITRYLEAELARNRTRLRAATAFYDREKTAAAIGRAMGFWGNYEDGMGGGQKAEDGRQRTDDR
jgi:outer membrane protein TolC